MDRYVCKSQAEFDRKLREWLLDPSLPWPEWSASESGRGKSKSDTLHSRALGIDRRPPGTQSTPHDQHGEATG